MSGLNNKGPENKGSRTGRGLGKCNPTKPKEEVEQELGRGMGRGNRSGLGKGMRRGRNI